MYLIDLPPNPGILARKIDLITQLFPHLLICSQSVERRCDDGRLLFLVVEEREDGDGHCDDKDGKATCYLAGYEGWEPGSVMLVGLWMCLQIGIRYCVLGELAVWPPLEQDFTISRRWYKRLWWP